jgi:ABC-type branched-subunit amino acid transport system substrate-binding protein
MKQQVSNAWRRIRGSAGALFLLFLLAGCAMPGDAAPVVKLGVIAPFEGRGRALGYAILSAVKEAVAEVNASGSLGPYRVTVAAFNDNLDPNAAAAQAAALALDPDVIGVVGPFSPETAAAALPLLERSHIPSRSLPADLAGTDHAGEQARAKLAARELLSSLAADIRANRQPVRQSGSNP